MAWLNTKDVLDALQTKIAALEYEGEPFVESVILSTFRSLKEAMASVFKYQSRAAVLIPDEERYSRSSSGRFLIQDKSQLFTLILSDRDYAPGQKPFFGDGTHPGVVNVKDAFAREIVGHLDGVHGAVVSLVDGEPARVSDKDAKLGTGREGYVIQLSVTMGTEKRSLPRGVGARR